MRTHVLFSVPVVAALTACAADSQMTGFIRPASLAPAPTVANGKTRHFTLQYEATVKEAAAGSQSADLWIPIAQDAPFQTISVTKIAAPAGHEVNVEPTLGNKMLHVRVPAAQLPITVRVEYDVVRHEEKTDFAASAPAAALSAAERDRYLAGSKLVPVGAEVATLSGGFMTTRSDPISASREAYDHVLGKMRYSKDGTGWGTGSTEWACSAGYGNCTDFHAYFMSLTRSNHVPSRFLMGFPVPADKTEGEIGGYHCWAEFFADGKGWIPVDISEADKVVDKQPAMADYYFGGLTADRIEFTTGRDVPLLPAAARGPRNFFIYPYCEIDGKDAGKDAVTKKFTFKDLP